MTTFRVLYRRAQNFHTPAAVPATDFEVVATVEAEDLEDLFQVMNDGTGSDSPAVRQILGVRSMSVGDIAVENGQDAFICREVGWARVAVV